MSFENINDHNKEPERELLTTGHQNRRRGDDDHNTAKSSNTNTKSGVQDSTETKRLYSFECAEREIENRRIAMQQRQLKLEKYYFECTLKLEERLYGKPSLTPARIEEIAAQAKRDAKDATSKSFENRLLPSERIKLLTNLELWELKRFKCGLWNHRIVEGFKVWAKDRQGKLRRTHRKFNDIHTDILLEEAARSLGT